MFCKYFIQNDIKRSSFVEYHQSQVLFFHVQACCIGNLSRLYSVIFDIKFENQCALQQNYLLETIQNGDCRKGEKVYKILAGYYSRLNFAYFL